MKAMQLLDRVTFEDGQAHAEPLLVSPAGRVLRFALRPGQSIKPHNAPGSPFIAVVLRGHGTFASRGHEEQVGPNSLLVFDPGEEHEIRASGDDLVFIGILHPVPGTSDEHISGSAVPRES